MKEVKIAYISISDAIFICYEDRSIKKQKVKNIIKELVYFGLFDRRLFEEYNILTSEELQRAIPDAEMDERYRLVDPPQVKTKKSRKKEAVQEKEELTSVDKLRDVVQEAENMKLLMKSIGTTDEQWFLEIMEEFIAYQTTLGNNEGRTMRDIKRHLINYAKRKVKSNGTIQQQNRTTTTGCEPHYKEGDRGASAESKHSERQPEKPQVYHNQAALDWAASVQRKYAEIQKRRDSQTE